MEHNQKHKKIIALKKASSLLQTITQMVESDRYCIDIMQQNLAAIGLLRNLHAQLMEDHLQHCFTQAVSSQDKKKQQKMVEEILQVTKLVNK
jgi:DNA-binding FrmR family transcriptional regulator